MLLGIFRGIFSLLFSITILHICQNV